MLIQYSHIIDRIYYKYIFLEITSMKMACGSRNVWEEHHKLTNIYGYIAINWIKCCIINLLQGIWITLNLKESVFCASTLCELFLDVVLKLRDGLYFISRESRGESHFLLSAWNPLGISDSSTHGHNNSHFFLLLSLPVLQRTFHWYSDLFNIFVMWFSVTFPFSSPVFNLSYELCTLLETLRLLTSTREHSLLYIESMFKHNSK